MLLLRDVLGYRANENAELLGLTEDAVTSALNEESSGVIPVPLQAFAGSAPVTRASGRSRSVVRRRTNNRLAGIGYSWAFTAASRPSPTREHYLRRRERGDRHASALRHLLNRMLGQLHHCLHTGQTCDPAKAFPTFDAHQPAAA